MNLKGYIFFSKARFKRYSSEDIISYLSIWLFSILWKNSSNHRGAISKNNPVDHGPSFVSLKITPALAHISFFLKITLLWSCRLNIFFFSFGYFRDTSHTVLTFSSEVFLCGLQYKILVKCLFQT